MANATDTLENTIIDHLLRNQAYTPPSTLYLALTTTIPTDAALGTEVVGGSYARQVVTLSAASGGATSNSNLLTYTNMPAVTVVGWMLMAHITSTALSNYLVHGTMTVNKTYTAGQAATIQIGDLDIGVF